MSNVYCNLGSITDERQNSVVNEIRGRGETMSLKHEHLFLGYHDNVRGSPPVRETERTSTDTSNKTCGAARQRSTESA